MSHKYGATDYHFKGDCIQLDANYKTCESTHMTTTLFHKVEMILLSWLRKFAIFDICFKK